MQRRTLVKVTEEAKRFLEAADDLLNAQNEWKDISIGIGTRKSGAVRRASMDLTRALTDLRQGK